MIHSHACDVTLVTLEVKHSEHSVCVIYTCHVLIQFMS